MNSRELKLFIELLEKDILITQFHLSGLAECETKRIFEAILRTQRKILARLIDE